MTWARYLSQWRQNLKSLINFRSFLRDMCQEQISVLLPFKSMYRLTRMKSDGVWWLQDSNWWNWNSKLPKSLNLFLNLLFWIFSTDWSTIDERVDETLFYRKALSHKRIFQILEFSGIFRNHNKSYPKIIVMNTLL